MFYCQINFGADATPQRNLMMKEKPQRPYRIALFGAGRIGTVHAQNVAYHPRSHLAAVVDVNAEAAEVLACRYGSKTGTAESALADESIDAIVVASATNSHADLIEAGVAAGKAVFCEKPIDLSLARSLACLTLIDAQNEPVMLGFNRRFDPNFIALKRALDNGEIGRGTLLSLTSFDPRPPPLAYVKASGGLFRDMAIHDFDLACWLLNAAPVRVTANGTCLVDPRIAAAGDIDTAVICLEFADGPLVTVRNSRRAVYGYDQRIEILGETGKLAVENAIESTLVTTSAEGTLSAKPQYSFLERYAQAYRAEWDHFISVVDRRERPGVGVRDGVIALTIADAAERSMRAGRSIDITYSEQVLPR